MNAIKFTVRGKIGIFCSLSQDKQYLLTEVKDQGIGIPKNEIKNLFQLFRTLPNGKAVNPNGIGLGLYLCKLIVLQ